MRLKSLAVAACLILSAAVLYSQNPEEKKTEPLPPQTLEKLATCMTKKGVTMYGAFWCPHCKEQKSRFGDAFALIHYVECGVPGEIPQGQTEACKAQNIHRYPTWIYPNGERDENVRTPEELAEKSGCSLK